MNFASLINKSQLLNEEQILSFKSWAYLRREAVRNLQKFSPLSKWWKGRIYTTYGLAWRSTYSIIYFKVLD